MHLLAFFIFAGCLSVSRAVNCYTCREFSRDFFDVETGLFKMTTNCSEPSSVNNFVETDTSCTGTCVTELGVSFYSISGYQNVEYEFSRSCLEGSPSYIMSQCDDRCTTSQCRICCDSDLCNNEPADKLIEEYRIGQTCYECRHSEIPGTGDYNPSCGLDFDPEGTGLKYSFCQGLCYSAVTFIEGVEDVQRGCRSDGRSCEYANHPYMEDKSVSFNSLDYDLKCCLGSLCNRAQSVGAPTSITPAAFFFFVGYLSLIL